MLNILDFVLKSKDICMAKDERGKKGREKTYFKAEQCFLACWLVINRT